MTGTLGEPAAAAAVAVPTTEGAPGESYRVYPYRWVVMAAFMFVNLTMQTLWISYASVTNQAARYYAVSHLEVGLLAMLFMILFVPLALPAAWAIDTLGFKTAVGFGAVLMGVCAIVRGLAGTDYTVVVVATIGIAAAQPFLINAWTKVPAIWMAPTERATGVAVVTLSNLVGIALGEALTPMLVKGASLGSVELAYGMLAATSAVVFLVAARDRPPTPPSRPGTEARALMLDGLKHALRQRPFLVYLAVWFMGMGIFNGVLTWVEDIVRPRGFTSGDAGVVGALVLVGGIVGCVAVAPLSDRRQQRVRFMLSGLILAIPGLLGLTFASTSWLLYLASFALGFFLISVGPIGMQYIAEVTRPTPEGTSQGMLQLVGQCSVALVYLMTVLKTRSGSYTPALLFAVGLLGLGAVLVSGLRDPAPTSPASTVKPQEVVGGGGVNVPTESGHPLSGQDEK